MTLFDRLPAPMGGVYAFTFDQPNDAFVLHSGPVTVVRGDEESTGDGRVWISVQDGFSPDPPMR